MQPLERRMGGLSMKEQLTVWNAEQEARAHWKDYIFAHEKPRQ